VSKANGETGMHSTRKYASKRARNAGASKDERDYRGRWLSAKRTSDPYEEGEIPFCDAKVASFLCPGGPVSYRIKSDSLVTDDWILEHVVPAINKVRRLIVVYQTRIFLTRCF
jgi:hypothetical protein